MNILSNYIKIIPAENDFNFKFKDYISIYLKEYFDESNLNKVFSIPIDITSNISNIQDEYKLLENKSYISLFNCSYNNTNIYNGFETLSKLNNQLNNIDKLKNISPRNIYHINPWIHFAPLINSSFIRLYAENNKATIDLLSKETNIWRYRVSFKPVIDFIKYKNLLTNQFKNKLGINMTKFYVISHDNLYNEFSAAPNNSLIMNILAGTDRFIRLTDLIIFYFDMINAFNQFTIQINPSQISNFIDTTSFYIVIGYSDLTKKEFSSYLQCQYGISFNVRNEKYIDIVFKIRNNYTSKVSLIGYKNLYDSITISRE